MTTSTRRRVLVTLTLTVATIVAAPVVVLGGVYLALWVVQAVYQLTR